jgi:hypothetical protein
MASGMTSGRGKRRDHSARLRNVAYRCRLAQLGEREWCFIPNGAVDGHDGRLNFRERLRCLIRPRSTSNYFRQFDAPFYELRSSRPQLLNLCFCHFSSLLVATMWLVRAGRLTPQIAGFNRQAADLLAVTQRAEDQADDKYPRNA